jgi:hypothetical protein
MSEKRSNWTWIIILIVITLGVGIVGGFMIARRSTVSEEATETGADSTKQLYTCGMHPQIIQEGPGNCPICGMKLTPIKGTSASSEAKPTGERKIKYWKSSMDPTYVSDKQGKDQMGMDLIPVYEDQVQEGRSALIRSRYRIWEYGPPW